MLILWGEHDFVFDMDFLLEWQNRFPDAKVKSFKDAGHYVLEDAADRIILIVKNFLKYIG
jgi:haloalkane dehalogenase